MADTVGNGQKQSTWFSLVVSISCQPYSRCLFLGLIIKPGFLVFRELQNLDSVRIHIQYLHILVFYITCILSFKKLLYLLYQFTLQYTQHFNLYSFTISFKFFYSLFIFGVRYFLIKLWGPIICSPDPFLDWGPRPEPRKVIAEDR